jgi:hypothetical protein
MTDRTSHPMHRILNPRIEPGYCECGCGEDISADVKGGPRRFAHGHNRRRGRESYRVDEETGCWVWLGGARSFGHGTHRGMSTHRLSWEYANGPIPTGLCVLHKCDNPPCMNPDHLFLGTIQDNNRDMMEKGRNRAASGVDHYRAKLTPKQVVEIRRRSRRGNGAALAREFGVHVMTISAIIHGKNWKDVA